MFNINTGLYFLDSREVAKMVEKKHSHLFRDIAGYIEDLTETNFGFSDFFIEASFVEPTFWQLELTAVSQGEEP